MQNQTLELYDIYTIVYTPWYKTWWFIIALSLVGLALITLGFYFLYLWYKQKNSLSEYQRIVNGIKSLNHMIEADPEQFYVELTSLLKHFFALQYGQDFLGTTDQEMLLLLEQKKLSKKNLDLIKKILEGVEYIKFAHQKAIREHCKNALLLSLSLIKDYK